MKTYVCIDLKSFYASVECVERGLDPMRTNLVVADSRRTEKTICLAVTPSLKSFGIPGRARLFEVVSRVKEVNFERKRKNKGKKFEGESFDSRELIENPALRLSYIAAPPRMALYMEYSTRIYDIYLRYVSPEDIHVYSVDEVFIDLTNYLEIYNLNAHDLTMKMIREVLSETGITATAGIGTNMYLAKIALDIEAKHIPPDKDGVRIALLNEKSYRENLWSHKPITDFWRVGRGYAKRLAGIGIYTMGDVARCSLTRQGEDLLYKVFGINAELLIDHAWGWEPCTIKEIKAYKPENKSMGAGQVLHCAYEFEKGRIIIREMAELLALDLVEKKLLCDQIVITVGYDIENLTKPEIRNYYKGEVVTDPYGRKIPKHAHGSENLGRFTSSSRLIVDAAVKLFDRICDEKLLIRRVNIVANHVIYEEDKPKEKEIEQINFFTDFEKEEEKKRKFEEKLKKERKMQEAVIKMKKKYGKNAVLKGTNLQEGATTIERNSQIGGHKA